MLSRTTIIRRFIPTTHTVVSLTTQSNDSIPKNYYVYRVKRTDPPYTQTVCLFIDSRPITNPLYDAGEMSLLENLESATETVALGFFTTEGEFISASSRRQFNSAVAYVDCESKFRDRFACLYLLQSKN